MILSSRSSLWGQCAQELERMIRIQRSEENEKKQMYLNAGTKSINQSGQASLGCVTIWAV